MCVDLVFSCFLMPQGKERKRGRVRHPTGLRPLKVYTYLTEISGARTRRTLIRIKGTSCLHRKPSVETSAATAPATGSRREVVVVAAVIISKSKTMDRNKEEHIY